jgi:hypothetical protein
MLKTIAKKATLLVAATAAFVVIAVAGPAMAASSSGPVTQTEYLYNGASWGPQLLVQLNNNSSVNYLAQQASPGCGLASNTVDTVKIWLSIAQAAQLAGKNVIVYYNTCGSTNYIFDITMQH